MSLQIFLRRSLPILWILAPQIWRQASIARFCCAQYLDIVVHVRTGDGRAVVLEEGWDQTFWVYVPRGGLLHYVEAVVMVEDFDSGDVKWGAGG